MPRTLAQWTGVAVTAIVVSGSDMDLLYAIPLGIFAGALATLGRDAAGLFDMRPDYALPVAGAALGVTGLRRNRPRPR